MGHLPITGFSAYDRFGLPYDVYRVLTPEMQLNVTAYQEYSPVYLPMTFALVYLISFMLVTTVIVDTILYEGRAILTVLRGNAAEEDDIHAKLMRRYAEVPSYYFLGLFLVFFPMLIGATKVGTSPPYGSQNSNSMSKVERSRRTDMVTVPCYSRTSYICYSVHIHLCEEWNVSFNQSNRRTHSRSCSLWAALCQYGKREVQQKNTFLTDRSQVFKTISVQSILRALTFLENLKLGHYLKVPPYASFSGRPSHPP